VLEVRAAPTPARRRKSDAVAADHRSARRHLRKKLFILFIYLFI
jgi:hypothetical protein